MLGGPSTLRQDRFVMAVMGALKLATQRMLAAPRSVVFRALSDAREWMAPS